jgi:hypothetical protein
MRGFGRQIRGGLLQLRAAALCAKRFVQLAFSSAKRGNRPAPAVTALDTFDIWQDWRGGQSPQTPREVRDLAFQRTRDQSCQK